MLDEKVRGYRLGMLYASYRFFVSLILFLIFWAELIPINESLIDSRFYVLLLTFYFMSCVVQLVSYGLFAYKKIQLIFSSVMDVLFFSLISYMIGQLNMHIGLMFVTTLFVINLVHLRRVGLTLTLLSIIVVVFLPFADGWVDVKSDNSFANSLILVSMFIIVRLLGWFSTKRFQALEEINDSQLEEIKRYQEISNAIMEQVDTGYIVMDEHGVILHINPAARSVLGVSECVGASLKGVNRELDDALQASLIFRRKKVSFPYKCGGLNVFVSHEIFSSENNLSLLIIEDMNKASEKLQALKLASLGRLSAAIAHEIRNPLSSIIQANALLESADAAEIVEYREVIDSQCDRINNIIKSTLDMAKMQKFEPSVVGLSDIFDRLMVEDLMGVSHQVEFRCESNINVLFDETHLRQVLVNLIRNALRHNNFTNSPVIKVKVREFSDFVEVDVVDFGAGVNPSIVNNLFDPFFTTEIGGTGLGLNLSKELCAINKADLRYIGDDGGTCFRISCMKQ